MGVSQSINTIVSNINNRVENKLIQDAGASADARCNITIGNISFTSTVGCAISVKNVCSARAEASVEAVIDATIEFYNDLTFEQKQEAPRWFTTSFGINTTVTNITNDFRQVIEQRCKSNAELDNTITINDITIKDCRAPRNEGIVNFVFTNTGTAEGQCAISNLLDLQVSGSNQVDASQSIGTSLGAYIPYIVAAIVLIAIIYIILKFRRPSLTAREQVDLELAKLGAVSSKLIQLSRYIRKQQS